MDTVQSVSKSLKLVSCALTSMRWLDIIKKLIAAAAIATAACSALSIIAACKEKSEKPRKPAVKCNCFTAGFCVINRLVRLSCREI